MQRLTQCGAALLWLAAVAALSAQVGKIPAGFTAIFNGRDIKGWHISRTVHHGTTGSYTVDSSGVLIMKAHPFGQGGLLLTDKSYKDFELYLEANPDAGFNSGIFLRSAEGGSAYQIELVRPGNTGALLSEQMKLSTPAYIGERTDINTVWKDGEWNSMRIRMTGEAPHITLWINDVKLWEVQMPQNDQIAGALRRDDRAAAALERHLLRGGPRQRVRGAVGGPALSQCRRQGAELMRVHSVVLLAACAGLAAAPSQEPGVTNSVGMELVLIKPGTMTVGRFQPPYPKPPAPGSHPPRVGAA